MSSHFESGVTASLSGLTISGGSSTGNGGGLYNDGTATLTNCTVSGNSAEGDGAAVANGTTATLTIVACTISDNTASGLSGYGGGVANSGTATLANCTISGNSAVDGGGLWNSGAAATLTLTDSTISGNSAGSGGGLWNSGTTATLTLTDCTISGNNATGGGLYNGAYADCDAHRHDRSREHRVNVTSDIAGTAAGEVTGTYNLVGTGGSGGITGGLGGNIVLTTLADLGLAPLADYGGPTQTIALLPGSVPSRRHGCQRHHHRPAWRAARLAT